MAKLVFGCGYLGARVAHLWDSAGETVYVVTRSAAKWEQFSARGWRPVVADITQPNSLNSALAELSNSARSAVTALPISGGIEPPYFDTVLFAVGYDRSANPENSIREVYTGGLRNALDALPRDVGRFIYISSTGVYGSADGDWVTEETPCVPAREGGIACLAAEEILRASPLGDRSIVLRLAGLYGPGRVPRRADLLAGRPIPAPTDGFFNLIHVDDAARLVLAVERQAVAPSLYLVSDGAPTPRRDYYVELARLLGASPPRFELPPAASPAALRAAADKRISNAKLLHEIEFTFAYPSYREGLVSALATP